jgi:hypothetical protein
MKVANWKGCVNFESDKKQIILRGQNGVGKSSVLDALAMVATCEPIPAGIKKNQISLFINHGKIAGSAAIGANSVSWPDCKASGSPITDRYSAGMERITGLKQGDFFALLQRLGADVTEKDIRTTLANFKADELKSICKRFNDYGLEQTFEFYKKERQKKKGAWEQVTGANYGSKGSPNWHPDGWKMEYESMNVDEIKAKINAIDVEREGYLQAREEYLKAHADFRANQALIDDKNRSIKALEIRIESIKNDLNELGEKQKSYKPAPKTTNCPSCGACLVISKSELYIPAGDFSGLIKKKIEECENLTSQIEAIEKTMPEPIDEPVFDLVDESSDEKNDLGFAVELIETKKLADKINTQVEVFDVLAKAFSKTGILKEKTEDTIKKYNALMAVMSKEADVHVDSDGNWYAFGFPLLANSKGERYCASIIAQVAYTLLAKNKALIIDDIDQAIGDTYNITMGVINKVKPAITYIICGMAVRDVQALEVQDL